ncbi:MAG: ribonuclease R [Clostridiaceae bacterium]|nr:ribonuclease R [Clostridiaceae bacterium]
MRKNNRSGKKSNRGLYKKNNIVTGKSFSRGGSKKAVKEIPSVSETSPRGPTGRSGMCIGILRKGESDYYVDPDPGYSFAQYGRIRIPPHHVHGAPLNMKVVCLITNPDNSAGSYTGEITEVLGDPEQSDVAMKAILLQYGIPEKFPEHVIREAERLPAEPSEEDIASAIEGGRKDLRTLQTITIDGEDAKDLDDAISVEKISGTGYRLFVHIADVAEYVIDSSPLDLEARNRGTSVYPVDRVIPMLPPRLSNGLCSLNPGVPRFALTVKMVIDYNGEVKEGEIFESIILSDARTSYAEVFDVLFSQKIIDRYIPFLPMLKDMNELMKILREKRMNRGTIDFSIPETTVVMDEKGKPTDIFPSPITDSNRIIEELMIICNEYVASRFDAMKHPFIYRVHEQPDELKISEFLRVARIFGAKPSRGKKVSPEFLSELMRQIEDEPYAPALSMMLLRSLAKARYLRENLGHFGLNSENYCHFTSPIRRYPDLYIHRIIKAYLHGDFRKAYFSKHVESIAEHSSEMERNASEAEREATEQKIAEYMVDHVGEEYEGIVSGISQAGLFVRLPNTAEGMVAFRTMEDYYAYDESRLEARGRQTGRVFRIGQSLLIKVASVDPILRRIDFVLTGEAQIVLDRSTREETRELKKRCSPRKTARKGKKKK